MKKYTPYVIAICVVLLTSCTSDTNQSENLVSSSIVSENVIDLYTDNTQSQAIGTERDTLAINNVPQITAQGNLFESLSFTTDTLPVNRDELHYGSMVLNKNPDDFPEELQYVEAITSEAIGAYSLQVSNITDDIHTVNASIFIDDELISNQIYMNELAEVHFNIIQDFQGKTLKVLASTSSLNMGNADITISQR